MISVSYREIESNRKTLCFLCAVFTQRRVEDRKTSVEKVEKERADMVLVVRRSRFRRSKCTCDLANGRVDAVTERRSSRSRTIFNGL